MDQLKLQRKKELQASVRFRSPEPVFRASTDKSDSDGACARTTLTGRSGRGNGDEGMWDRAGSTERAPEKKGRGSTGRKIVEAHGKVSVLSCTAARPPISLLLFLSSTQSSLFPPSPLPLLPPSPRLSLSLSPPLLSPKHVGKAASCRTAARRARRPSRAWSGTAAPGRTGT